MATFYLSSTSADLQECRTKAASTIQRSGHQVIGMENYVAEGRRPLDKCLADVAACDAYIGIFAWRYGDIPPKDNPKRKAFTELEYREAVRLGKELLIFILAIDAPWPGDRYADNEKERRSIKALRDELSRNHTVNFFKNSEELATQVSIAISPFPKPVPLPVPERLPPVPSPVPRPIPPVPIKWYALISIAALFVIIAGGAGVWRWRRALPPARPEYPSEKHYDFFLSEKPEMNSNWNLAPGWDMQKGEGDSPNDGALLVKGPAMSAPKDLRDNVFYDFNANFKVGFQIGDKIGWVLRAQDDLRSGYLFELKKEAGTVFLKGWILKDNKISDPLPGERPLNFRTCCNSEDGWRILVDVRGNKFKYHIVFEGETEEAGLTDDLEFIDNQSTFSWGTMGFLVTDGLTQPASHDGVMRIEYLYLTRLARTDARAEPSPAQGAR